MAPHTRGRPVQRMLDLLNRRTGFFPYRGFARHSPGALRMQGESMSVRQMNKIRNMYYVYILNSTKDKKFYIGSSGDLKRRMEEHKQGKVTSTRNRLPMRLICYEAYLFKAEALRREKFLKSSDGKKDLHKRLIESLT